MKLSMFKYKVCDDIYIGNMVMMNFLEIIKQQNFKCICRANDKSASVPVCYGRRVTSRTEITCLEDAIRLQRTHTEYRSPIGANDIG